MKNKHAPCTKRVNSLSSLFKINLAWFRDPSAGYPPDKKHLLDPEIETETENNEDNKKQPVEAISENLFRVNDPEIIKLLGMIKDQNNEQETKNSLDVIQNFLDGNQSKLKTKVIKLHRLKRGGEIK